MATQSETSAPFVDRETLISSHLALVGHIVRDVSSRLPSHVYRDDLVSAGMLALVQAAHSFDGALGVPFARFAARRIRGAILDELRGLDWASRSVRRRARDLERLRSAMILTLGRMPSVAELSAASGLSTAELAGHDRDVARASVTSLHAVDSDSPMMEIASHQEPVDVLLNREQMAYLADAVAMLPSRLKAVVEAYFLRDEPMAVIAEALDVSESRISQMRAEALVLLRHALEAALTETREPRTARSGVAERRRSTYVASVTNLRATRDRLTCVPETELVMPA